MNTVIKVVGAVVIEETLSWLYKGKVNNAMVWIWIELFFSFILLVSLGFTSTIAQNLVRGCEFVELKPCW